MVSGISRWVYFFLVLGFSLFFLFHHDSTRKIRRFPRPRVSSLALVAPFMVASIVDRWQGIGHEGQSFTQLSLRSSWAAVSVTLLLVICFAIRSALGTLHTSLVLASGVTLMSLVNSRIGDAIITMEGNLPAFIVGASIIAYLVTTSLIKSEQADSVFSKNSLRVFGVLAVIILSARVDGLKTEGAWFHVSYFSGVVQGVKSGGLLLWDTPSQYGFLNLLLPALIPGLNAESSFLLFQALLLFGVSIATVFSFSRFAPTGGGPLLGVVFVVIFFFADPSLVGPQPFPSSSAMRFGPSLLLLLFLNLRDQKTVITPLRDVTLAIAVAAAVLWSFESAFYSLMIFGMWTLAKTTSSLRRNERLWTQLRPQIFSVLSTMVLIVIYSLYVFVKVGDFPNWKWFYLPASKFAAGFGQLPTDLWGAVWLILMAILGCLLLVTNASDSGRASCFTSVGALLSWLTYYVGRSHSSNVIAMLPLIFVAMVIPTLKIASNYPTRQNHSVPELKKFISVPLAVIVVISGVVAAEVMANPLLPAVVARARPIPLQAVYEPAASFPNSLEQLLMSAELKRIPVAYQGYMGMLPQLPDSLRNRVDSEGTWLPLPLGLLEEPIPESVRSEMLERRFKRDPMSGYFIWHKSMSHPGRAELWLAEISKTHDCKVIAEDVDWQVSECLVRSQ